MVPIKTSIEDVQKVLAYLGKQIGWVDQPKIEKALGALDDRKTGAMVEFGLILRDGGNMRATPRGQLFNTDPKAALREVLASVDLYRSTLEWVHYGKRAETTAAEIGQYWEASHRDTLGGLSGTTLGSGAVTFGRVVDGAGLGTFLVGRSGKETRTTFDLAAVDALINGNSSPDGSGIAPDASGDEDGTIDSPATNIGTLGTDAQSAPQRPTTHPPSVSVSTSPSVHVNIEIHIAADATADTVREIFKNMARYVLDKPIADDGE
ncbi:MAG: hypothetical protein IPI13_11455 [Actinomycetales bacterium]|uniref:Uncharacterized protein n=1 Tax=Candidatus Phosphoribacter hodrii TaxID=2953743 RepID=A0A935IRI6_9MICO|nr:hypothetical protein [Candidatus Phosphoribacter hodrii]HBX82601.1 hypothetical protein [Propionibacteriaceae bacterium]